jgi:uncharacterized NAD(P)/FAD-binding protein YdhS
MTEASHDVAIIGAGFSGTMVAVHLARLSKGTLRIALVERGGEAGRGIAYGTADPLHLLNVRAGNMGAFPDRIDDFHAWLREAGISGQKPESFVPRRIYGAYLADTLRRTRVAFPCIDVVAADVTDLPPCDAGYELWAGSLRLATARCVVLALGNFPPGEGQSGNPYAPALREKLAGSGDVFLIGTGLTSLDMLATMACIKPRGTIHILSRGGLYPQVHQDVQCYPSYVDEHDLPQTALALLAMVRREVRKAAAQGIGWQSVIDALRPLNQKLWQALPLPEQRRFLHRIRPYWDTHRHRCAPEVMAAKDRLLAEGRLIQHRGRFVSMTDTGDGIAVTWQPHGGSGTETTTVQCAVSCTGPQSDLVKLDDPLIRTLLKRGLMAPDMLRLGANTAPDGALKSATGDIVPNLYTIGTWRKGALYESVAVPELRMQARDLAETIAQTLMV